MANNFHILQGLSAILNEDNLRPGVDVREIERRMVSGGFIEKQKDPTDKFSDELKETAAQIGIKFSEFFGEDDEPNPPWPRRSPPRGRSPSRGYSPSRESPERSPSPRQRSPSPPRQRSPSPQRYKSPSPQRYKSPSPPPTSRYRSPSPAREPAPSMSSWRDNWESPKENDMSDYEKTLEREKREDMKTAMLEEIDSLWSSLLEEDIDLTRITRPTPHSSYEEVDVVLKILRHKNDRSRYCSFAEEFLLFGAYGLEELFDGQRVWFGRYRPDLRGWHNSVNIKLRRMRHDTSTLVSGVMQNYNIGPAARLLLELVPNMFLHSKMRKQQYNTRGIYQEIGDAEMAQMTERIRNF